MLNAMIWALACFGVVAADIALSVVLFSALGVASVFMSFSIDDLDIQLLQAVAQTASFLRRCCVALSMAAFVYGTPAKRTSARRGSAWGVETHRRVIVIGLPCRWSLVT